MTSWQKLFFTLCLMKLILSEHIVGQHNSCNYQPGNLHLFFQNTFTKLPLCGSSAVRDAKHAWTGHRISRNFWTIREVVLCTDKYEIL